MAQPSGLSSALGWIVVALLVGVAIGQSMTDRPDPWPPYARVYTHVGPSVVTVGLDGPDPREGSGFAIARDRVVTARHLVVGVDALTVSDIDGRRYDARVLGTDARTDLALLEVPGGVLPSVQLGASDLHVGDTILAIGNPFGLGHSLSVGVVGSTNRRIVGADGVPFGPARGFLQLSIPLNPGNSGGPVFDGRGRVVAILSGTHAQGQAIAFAVPVEVLIEALDQLELGERLSRAYIGVRTEANADHVLIAAVTPAGPGARAGLRVGDRLTSLDGAVINSPEAFHAALDRLTAGTTAQIGFERAGAAELVAVELSDWAEHTIVVAGMTLDPAAGTGGKVVAIRPRSRAETAGVRIGDMVRSVGGLPVQAPADVQQAIAMGRGPIEVLRDGAPMTLSLPEAL